MKCFEFSLVMKELTAISFQDDVRREHAQHPRKVFLSPDMTAVVDRDVIDATKRKPPKSI